VGSLEEPSGRLAQNLLDSDHDPNAVTSAVHDRMPVILEPESYDLWLDPWMKNVGAASDLLKPYDAQQMRCYPISTRNDPSRATHALEMSTSLNGVEAILDIASKVDNGIGLSARISSSDKVRSDGPTRVRQYNPRPRAVPLRAAN